MSKTRQSSRKRYRNPRINYEEGGRVGFGGGGFDQIRSSGSIRTPGFRRRFQKSNDASGLEGGDENVVGTEDHDTTNPEMQKRQVLWKSRQDRKESGDWYLGKNLPRNNVQTNYDQFLDPVGASSESYKQNLFSTARAETRPSVRKLLNRTLGTNFNEKTPARDWWDQRPQPIKSSKDWLSTQSNKIPGVSSFRGYLDYVIPGGQEGPLQSSYRFIRDTPDRIANRRIKKIGYNQGGRTKAFAGIPGLEIPTQKEIEAIKKKALDNKANNEPTNTTGEEKYETPRDDTTQEQITDSVGTTSTTVTGGTTKDNVNKNTPTGDLTNQTNTNNTTNDNITTNNTTTNNTTTDNTTTDDTTTELTPAEKLAAANKAGKDFSSYTTTKKNYVYEKDPDGKVKTDEFGYPVIKKDADGNDMVRDAPATQITEEMQAALEGRLPDSSKAKITKMNQEPVYNDDGTLKKDADGNQVYSTIEDTSPVNMVKTDRTPEENIKSWKDSDSFKSLPDIRDASMHIASDGNTFSSQAEGQAYEKYLKESQGKDIAEARQARKVDDENVTTSKRQATGEDGKPLFEEDGVTPVIETDYAEVTDASKNADGTTKTATLSERQATGEDGKPLFDSEGNPVMETDYAKADETVTVGAATRTKQVVDKDEQGNPIILADGTTKMKTVADVSPGAVINPSDISVEAGEATAATIAAEYKTETTDAEGNYTNKALVDKVSGTVSPEGKAKAMAVVGLSERKITRYKKQLRNAGLSEEEIKEFGNDPELLEDRVLDFTEEQRGVIEGLPEEALVSTQIESLLEGMEEGNIPMWANPAVDAVNQMLAERGMSASTVGRDALFNSIIQSAMPIAQSNAQAIQASVAQGKDIEAKEAFKNAENAQAAALQTANSVFQMDMANFSAEQQAAVTNAKFFQTVALTEANYDQQTAIQNAVLTSQANIAEADMQTKARINNANAFLQMDMANLTNEQQSKVLKAQIENQRVLSNQSAENAMKNLNITEKNKVDMFMTNIAKETSLANAAAANNMTQFNASVENAAEARRAGRDADLEKFNAQMRQDIDKSNADYSFKRESWNAANSAAVNASNIAWRRKSNEINTAASNAVNMTNAMNSFKISSTALAAVWQQKRDEADHDWKSYEAGEQRRASVVIAAMGANSNTYDSKHWEAGFNNTLLKALTETGASTELTKLPYG